MFRILIRAPGAEKAAFLRNSDGSIWADDRVAETEHRASQEIRDGSEATIVWTPNTVSSAPRAEAVQGRR